MVGSVSASEILTLGAGLLSVVAGSVLPRVLWDDEQRPQASDEMLVASPPVCDNQKCLQTLPDIFREERWGQGCLWLRTTALQHSLWREPSEGAVRRSRKITFLNLGGLCSLLCTVWTVQ